MDDNDERDILLLMRNKELEYECSYCDQTAVAICPFCVYEDGGLLCKTCIGSHKCIKDEGEDILLPVVNSPRTGECGYDGYRNKAVKKYFPKGII
ncbi:MAG: hypothetical protein Q7J65_02100 [Candidatus Marinimicrobia bacterium]|nr:hypothetical protein [Candidatus Neomarinimicrobiota bacterium]